MVFGYYHITMRTLDQQEASALGCPPNGTISQKVKVGHMLWIPFFPLGKYWVMEAGGQIFKLNNTVIQQIEAKHGPKGMPWYAFFGLIAIPIVLGLGSISSSMSRKASQARSLERHNQTVEKRMAAINAPVNTDYYHFKSKNYKDIVLKVDEAAGDSIRFEAPMDNQQKKWRQNNWAAGFYAGDSPTQKVSFAVADLKSSFNNTYGANDLKRISSPKLTFIRDLQLDKIVHMAGIEIGKEGSTGTVAIPVVSVEANNAVKKDLQAIIDKLGDTQFLMDHMDKASYEYYQKMLANAGNTDAEAAKYIRGKSSNFLVGNIAELETMLYTKYMYLKTGDEQERNTDNLLKSMKDMKGYLFFLSLTDRSFLTIDGERAKKMKITEVEIPSENKAKVKVTAPSNILKTPKTVTFNVAMSKEDGEWKVNVPSTYSYTTAQVLSSGGYGNIGAYMSQFREMIITDVEGLIDGKKVHPDFKK